MWYHPDRRRRGVTLGHRTKMRGEHLLKGDAIPFVQIAHAPAFSDRISLKAKGLYLIMYAKPDRWEFSAKRIAGKDCRDGVDAVRAAMNELIAAGYLSRRRLPTGRMEYKIWVTPQAVEKGAKSVHKPRDKPGEKWPEPKPENPCEGKSLQGKIPSLSNKDVRVTRIDKKQVSGRIFKNLRTTDIGKIPSSGDRNRRCDGPVSLKDVLKSRIGNAKTR